MAESDAGWWGWLQNAKEKVVSQSAEVLEFVTKDIDEFRTVVSEEASSLVSSTAVALKEKLKLDDEDSAAASMKKSVSGFLNHVAEVFTPPPDDDDQEAIVIQNQQPIFLDRLQTAIYAVRQDPATYLIDPEEEEAQYEKWLQSFDLESKQNEISQLLVDNEVIQINYTTLVPSQVSHLMFWHRYFYKIDKLEKAEAKRQELKKRAQNIKADGEIIWDDDEEFGGEGEIPEQMQQQLLEEYEKESKNTNGRSKNIKKGSKEHHQEIKDSVEQSTKVDHYSKEPLTTSSDRTSSRNSPASTESLSNEDEWEKVNTADAELCPENSAKDSTMDKSEDWENWE